MSNVCFQYLVVGRVQGVWFRSFAKKSARRLCITSWVRNTGKGAVEILACGEEKIVLQFEKRLRKGHPLAKVENVYVKKLAW